MKIVEIIRDEISYQVHPYTELFGIMAILADNNSLYKDAGNECFNSNYRNEIIQWFSPFRNHKAVLLLTEYTSDYSFNYDAPCALFLELGDNVNGLSDYIAKERLPIPDIQIYKLRKTIHDFILESNFEEFYNINENRYRRSIESFIQKLRPIPLKIIFSNLLDISRTSLLLI